MNGLVTRKALLPFDDAPPRDADAFAQVPVNCGGGKPEPFQRPGRARVAQVRSRSKEFLGRERQARVLIVLRLRDARAGGIAVDAAANEVGDEPRVPDGLRATVHEKPREERVIDESVPLAGGDRRADLFRIVAPTLESLPKL